MKYFYFNPKSYDLQYHVMAETVEDAWTYLKIYFEGEYQKDLGFYTNLFENRVKEGSVDGTLEAYLSAILVPVDKKLLEIRETYAVEELREGEVNVTEVS